MLPEVALSAGGPGALGPTASSLTRTSDAPEAVQPVPDYLRLHYWWAYVHPKAVRVFERAWLVNLILWGNYERLVEAALGLLGARLPGRTLQVACVYGDLTNRLAGRVADGHGQLDVVDVLPVQLANLRRKLPADAPVQLLRQDSSALAMADACYERALLFFLLHEQPADIRHRTVSEALRVVRPGGRLVIVDFASPRWWHPLRYLWLPVLRRLEPFAAELWADDIRGWLKESPLIGSIARRLVFGGMYQMVTITRAGDR